MGILNIIKRFKDDSGTVYVYVGLLAVALMGAIALSLDGGRFFTLNTQLQSAADASAMAAAGELDGRVGAMARATLAAQTGLLGAMTNRQTFATDGQGADVKISGEDGAILFLRRLPPDTDNISAGDIATTDVDARFVRVVVERRRVDNWLSRPLAGLMSWETNAAAVAGYGKVNCRVPPLFMCNPFESAEFVDASMSAECLSLPKMGQPGAPFADKCLPKGSLVLLKTVGQGADYVPGNFGLLDPVIGNQGAINVADNIATDSPKGCFSERVSLRTGEAMGPVRAAINVRFDVYNNPAFQNKKDDPAYRPSLNVTKGFVHTKGACNPEKSTDPLVARGLPRDDCYATGTCKGNNRFGLGNWDRDGYWAVNHGPSWSKPAGYSEMSRYEVYQWELANHIPNNYQFDATRENGNPMCSPHATSAGRDRRVMNFAVINCLELGPISGNSGGPYPTVARTRIFLTQPAEGQGTEQADIYAEILPPECEGTNCKDDGGHEIVQLYR